MPVVYLDEELHHKLRIFCNSKGMKIKSAIAEAVGKYLQSNQEIIE